MTPAELAWRGRAAARRAADRLRVAVRDPGWNRRALARRLDSAPRWRPTRDALARGRWSDAHEALTREVVGLPPRFVIAPALKDAVSARIRRVFPDSAVHAASRADRIVDGEYDLLVRPWTGSSIRFTVAARRAAAGPPSPTSTQVAATTRSSGSSIGISTG
jgi:hypothetical protein